MAKQNKKCDVVEIGVSENVTGIPVDLDCIALKVLLCKKTDIALVTTSNSLSPVINEVEHLCF